MPRRMSGGIGFEFKTNEVSAMTGAPPTIFEASVTLVCCGSTRSVAARSEHEIDALAAAVSGMLETLPNMPKLKKKLISEAMNWMK